MKGVDEQLKKLEDYRKQLNYLEVCILDCVVLFSVSGSCS